VDKKALLIAAGLLMALIVWIASGYLTRDPVTTAESERPVPQPFLVEVRESHAQPTPRTLVVYGETAANRRVVLRAETSGPVVELAVARGARVAAGETLVRLHPAARASRLRQARALLEESRATYDATQTLAGEGFQADIEARRAFAALQQAQAEVEAAEEALRQTNIVAPFAGVLDGTWVELGDYVSPGVEVATLLELNPLMVWIDIPQRVVDYVDADTQTQVRFLDGRRIDARLRYLAVAADPSTRTFPAEVEIDNSAGALRAGLSVAVELELQQVRAHFVSPAHLSLDADGQLGLKTVDDENRVHFHPVEIVRSEADGVWVTGLPEQARIITVGQGYVDAGQTVRTRVVDARGADG